MICDRCACNTTTYDHNARMRGKIIHELIFKFL
jgi:hypothetical protein